MTDDEMRLQVLPRTKPDPYALQLVRNAWFSAYSIPIHLTTSPAFIDQAKKRQVYGGDDLIKDGAMAKADGIAFLYHDGSADRWPAIDRTLVQAIETGAGFNNAA